MKTIKIFLASSEELKEERKELADLVEHLNFTLGKQDITIQLVKWEYLDSSMGPLHKQEEYNRELRDCELCMVLYWTRFGMYTKTELDTAYQELCSGRNPKKLYVYFKDGEEISSDLREFRDGFPSQYGHFYCHFHNIDTLKADFLLQFMEYLNVYLKDRNVIEIKDSQVTINGKVYVNLQNVPFAGNNDEYNLLLKSIKKTKKLLAITDEDDPDYAEYASELKELEEKQSQMESSLWDTALMVTKLSTTKCSERLQRAMELFGCGDNKGAQAILNEEEIEKDVQHNLHLIELGEEGKKGLHTNMEEYLLKIKTLESDMPDGWSQKAQELYHRCMEIGIRCLDAADYAGFLSDYGDFLANQCIYDQVEDVYLKSNETYETLNVDGNYDGYISWNLRQLANFYIISGDFTNAEKVLNRSMNLQGKHNNKEKKIADLQNSLAYLYYAREKFDKSEELYKKVIRLLETESDDESKGIIEDSHYYLALLYKDTYRYELSIHEAEAALAIHDSLSDNGERQEDIFNYRLYEVMGNAYDCCGKTDLAEVMFNRCLTIVRDAVKYDPEGYGIYMVCCLGNLSRIHRFKNEFSLSIQESSEALSLMEKLFRKHPVQYSAFYAQVVRDLAYLFKETKQFEKAISTAKEALPAYDILLSTEAQRYRVNKENTYNLLGCIYLENKQYEEASENLLNALNLTREIISNSDLDYSGNLAQVLTNLGYLETLRKNFAAAELYFLEANQIYLSESFKVSPDANTDLAILELDLGYLYECKTDWNESLKWYKQSHARLNNIKSARDQALWKSLLIKNLLSIAFVYIKTDDYMSAESFASNAYNESNELFKDSPVSSRELYTRAANRYAWVLYKTQKLSEAKNYATIALTSSRELKDKIILRCSLDTNACIDRALELYEDSEIKFKEAIEICMHLCEDNNDYMSSLAYEQKELAKLYSLMGNCELRDSFCSQAKAIYDNLSPDEAKKCEKDIIELNAIISDEK